MGRDIDAVVLTRIISILDEGLICPLPLGIQDIGDNVHTFNPKIPLKL
jgi:hypothetical protein